MREKNWYLQKRIQTSTCHEPNNKEKKIPLSEWQSVESMKLGLKRMKMIFQTGLFLGK